MGISSPSGDGRGSVSEGPGSVGTRVVDTKYPAVAGLTAGDTKQVSGANLIPLEKPSDG